METPISILYVSGSSSICFQLKIHEFMNKAFLYCLTYGILKGPLLHGNVSFRGFTSIYFRKHLILHQQDAHISRP
jgi:hypothetical protein